MLPSTLPDPRNGKHRGQLITEDLLESGFKEYFCVLVKSRQLQPFRGNTEHLRMVGSSLKKQPVSAQQWS